MKKNQFKQSEPASIPNLKKVVIPPSAGRGERNTITFSSGLRLSTLDWQLNRLAVNKGCCDEHAIGFSFWLEGGIDVLKCNLSQPSQVSAGDSNFFFSFPESSEFIEQLKDKKVKRVGLWLEGEFLARLSAGDEDYFYTVLKSLDSKSVIRIGHTTTPAMKSVLHQILHCPYGGMTGQIFLEAKAMELLALKLEQINSRTICTRPSMKPADTERIYYAAKLLVRDPVNPPDLTEISGKIGMSRSKFFRYFKMVFGHSPMDHLRDHRLQTARQLLLQGGNSVSEVAFAVGFNNLSYFSKAFFAQFGILPHQEVR